MLGKFSRVSRHYHLHYAMVIEPKSCDGRGFNEGKVVAIFKTYTRIKIAGDGGEPRPPLTTTDGLPLSHGPATQLFLLNIFARRDLDNIDPGLCSELHYSMPSDGQG